MKALRLTLSLAAFVLACAFPGAAAAGDTNFPPWGGALLGAALGAFFGCAFGGIMPRPSSRSMSTPSQPGQPSSAARSAELVVLNRRPHS
jgi:hypothetical protein